MTMFQTCLLGLALLATLAPVAAADDPLPPEKVVTKTKAVVDHCVDVDPNNNPPVYVREDCLDP